MADETHELRIKGRSANLGRIVDFVEDACVQAGIEPAARFDIQLAVEEACANVINHAYRGQGGELFLRLEMRERDLIVTLRDWGQAFDPEQVARPDLERPLEERPLGGLGLHLMRKLMDEVHFSFLPGEGNRLVMIRHGVVPGEKYDVAGEAQGD